MSASGVRADIARRAVNLLLTQADIVGLVQPTAWQPLPGDAVALEPLSFDKRPAAIGDEFECLVQPALNGDHG